MFKEFDKSVLLELGFVQLDEYDYKYELSRDEWLSFYIEYTKDDRCFYLAKTRKLKPPSFFPVQPANKGELILLIDMAKRGVDESYFLPD